jgi:AraC-like DNA-binding protein
VLLLLEGLGFCAKGEGGPWDLWLNVAGERDPVRSTDFRELRLRHADWLVRNTRRPLTDIAVECGFADASHFSRCYRAQFGCPPSAERQLRAKQAAGGDASRAETEAAA